MVEAVVRASRGRLGRLLGHLEGSRSASWGILRGPGGGSWGILAAQERPRAAQGASWRVLGASWGALGASWAPLGASWGRLGRLLGRLGGVLDRPGRPGTPLFPHARTHTRECGRSASALWNRTFPARAHAGEGASWGVLGLLIRPSWAVLGALEPHFSSTRARRRENGQSGEESCRKVSRTRATEGSGAGGLARRRLRSRRRLRGTLPIFFY